MLDNNTKVQRTPARWPLIQLEFIIYYILHIYTVCSSYTATFISIDQSLVLTAALFFRANKNLNAVSFTVNPGIIIFDVAGNSKILVKKYKNIKRSMPMPATIQSYLSVV